MNNIGDIHVLIAKELVHNHLPLVRKLPDAKSPMSDHLSMLYSGWMFKNRLDRYLELSKADSGRAKALWLRMKIEGRL